MSTTLLMWLNTHMKVHDEQAQSGATPWLTDAEQGLWRNWILVTSRLDTALARQLQNDSGISLTEYAVLVYVSEHPDKRERIAALADALQWDRSRLSHQITRMIKRGLVRREDCSNDRRGAFVAIEDHGMEIIKNAAPGHVNAVRSHMFAQLDEQDIADLDRVLEKLASHFKD